MAQFATADDLAARLGIELSDADQTRAGTLLEHASALIQAEARQQIERIEDDTLQLRGTTDDQILLPERPVESVASVSLDGQAISDWYLDGNAIVRRPSLIADVTGAPICRNAGFGWRYQTLAIVYTHGYAADEIPPAIVALTIELVVPVWINPGNVMGERHGSEQVTYLLQGIPTGLGLTPDQRRLVRRMFTTGSAAVTLT